MADQNVQAEQLLELAPAATVIGGLVAYQGR